MLGAAGCVPAGKRKPENNLEELHVSISGKGSQRKIPRYPTFLVIASLILNVPNFVFVILCSFPFFLFLFFIILFYFFLFLKSDPPNCISLRSHRNMKLTPQEVH